MDFLCSQIFAFSICWVFILFIKLLFRLYFENFLQANTTTYEFSNDLNFKKLFSELVEKKSHYLLLVFFQ